MFGTVKEDPAITAASQSKQLFSRIKKKEKKMRRKLVKFTRAKIPQNMLVIDSGATVHLISNPDMMQNLHHKNR